MALAPLSATAFGQNYGVPPAYVPSGYQAAGGYAPAGPPGGYAPVGGYGGPAGPMVAPPPMGQGGGPAGIAVPSGSVFTPRLVTSSGFGDGLGWDDGYTSVGAWLPIGLNDDSQVLYLDARGFGSYDEGGGGNFNAGYRYYVPGLDRFFGGYIGYDIDAGNADSSTFNRAAIGAESVGKILQYRVNGYIPVGDNSEVVASGQVGDPFFRENNIFFTDRTLTRHQYGGVDGEIGGALPLIGHYGLSGFLGGYWLTSDADDTVGFKGRLEANINDDLQVGGKLTHDEIFDTNVWVTMTLRSPKGSWSDFFRRDWLRQPKARTLMDRSPEREYRIATDVKTNDDDILAINPDTGVPYLVLHVDPVGDGGAGTFEDPSDAINGPNNANFDIVYVRPGELVSFGPVALFDDQRLLSTAVRHTFDTQRGTFLLPGFTGGPLPVLRNAQFTPSSVVQLANNNEVSGFTIDGTGTPNFGTGFPTFHAGIVSRPGGITSFDINRNQFIDVSSGTRIAHVGTGTGFFDDNLLTGFGFGASTGFGLAVNGGSLDLSVTGNTITGFVGEDANGNNALDVGEDVNANLALDPGRGMDIQVAGGTLDAEIEDNTVTGNETGISLRGTGGAVTTADFDGNEVSGSVEEGVLITADDSTTTASFTDNEFVGNGGPGVDVVGTGASVFDLTVGGPSFFFGNLFDGNGGAGLAVRLSDTSTLTADIRNNEFVNQVDDGDVLTPFSGSGIYMASEDNASIFGVVIDRNNFQANAFDGLTFETQDLATLADILIGNIDGDNNNGNRITGNARDGINLFRNGAARVDDFRIVDNDIFTNGRDGIWLTAAGSQSFDLVDALIEDNLILENGTDGIHLEVRSDAILSTEIYDNVITGNGNAGIISTEILVSVFDQRSVTGFWDNNLIANNGGNGISSNAATAGLVVGQRADGTSDGNLIVENGLAGVLINSAGDAQYFNNVIAANGAALGNVFTGAISIVGAGIDIQGPGFKGLEFVGNEVVDNFGDGVEINNNSNSFDLVFTDNIVNDNRGRGYDILNQDDAFTDLTIQDTALGESQINQNDFEGVYVVNTSSDTQNQTAAAPQPSGNFAAAGADPTHGMAADGDRFDIAQLRFTFLQNVIVGNGTGRTIPEVFDSAGLAIRVGTSDGGYSLTGGGPGAQVGGFVSDGNQLGGVPFSQTANFVNGGVIASVNGNFFAGNQGSDFYTESFTSTVTPPGTAGVWSDVEFRIDNGDNSDPLARMDLEFIDNTFDVIDPINLGAFYNNDEANFKSRTGGRTAPDPNGPFTSGTRRRNAQRLAFRDNLPPFDGPNQPGDGNEYKYQGMGDSTFRVTNDTVVQNPIFLNEVFLPGSIGGERSYTYSIIP